MTIDELAYKLNEMFKARVDNQLEFIMMPMINPIKPDPSCTQEDAEALEKINSLMVGYSLKVFDFTNP